MTAPHDLDRQLEAFLREGPTELPDPSFDAVRGRMESTRQRVVLGPWRLPDVNKIIPIGLGAAAVVGVVLIGARLLGPVPSGIGGPPSAAPSPSASPSASPAASPSAAGGADFESIALAEEPVPVSVMVSTHGWKPIEPDGLSKNDDGKDPPDTVGAALLAWSWPAGTAFNVFGDPCHWTTTSPDAPATTPDEIAAAFADQALTEPSEPVDVTIGGYTGKSVTLTVPMAYDLPGATREERFGDCDQDIFAFYGVDGGSQDHERNAQGAGQIDELWILDVNGKIVILDAAYGPGTPAELVEELRAVAESATFD